MKYLFLILISLPLFASNWMPVSKIQSKSNEAYQLESDCVKTGEQCFDVGDEPDIVALGFTVLKDEYDKKDQESCLDPDDCELKFQALVCSKIEYEKIKNIDQLKVYCVKLIGKSLEKDKVALKAAKDAEKQAKKDAIDAVKNEKLAIKNDVKNANTVVKVRELLERLILIRE